jgi:hypothetical protein
VMLVSLSLEFAFLVYIKEPCAGAKKGKVTPGPINTHQFYRLYRFFSVSTPSDKGTNE